MKYLSIFLLAILLGCNGVKEGDVLQNVQGNSTSSSLELTPAVSNILITQSQQFTASGGTEPYTYSILTGHGAISTSGLYTASSNKGTATVRVTDANGATRDALLIIDVAMTFTPASRKINATDSFSFTITDGTPPYTFAVTSGSSTVSAAGIFTASATAEVAQVTVTDAHGLIANATIQVGNGPIISPILANAPESGTYQYTVTSGTAPLTWTIQSGIGTISAAGLYTAPATSGTAVVRVTDVDGFYTESTMTVSKSKLAVGTANNSCVLNKATNQVKCVGMRNAGQTGDGKFIIGDELSDMGDNLLPIKWPSNVNATTEVTSFSQGLNHGCGIFSDGLTRCWGSSSYGGNGNNTLSLNMIAGQVEGSIQSVPADIGNPIVALATRGGGHHHTCGVFQDGTLKCWGYNANGQLGKDNILNYGSDYSTLSLYNATPIALGQTVRKVETGYQHTCAILNDYNVKCWGYNAYGQLGKQHATNIGSGGGAPYNMASLTSHDFALDVVDLALGNQHSCVLLTDNKLRCWGYNGYGELGLGTAAHYGDGAGENPTSLAAMNLGTGRTVLQVDFGYHHICALLDNHQVKCWGHNGFGQLGYGHTNNLGDNAGEMGDSLPYVDLGTGRTATAIYAGGFSTCAVLDNGSTKCWGYNGWASDTNLNGNSLGIGVSTMNNIGDAANEMGDNLPTVNWGTGLTVLQISAQEFGTCALLDDGTNNVMKCIGGNSNGGNGLENISVGDEPGDLGSAVRAVDFGTSLTISSIIGGQDHTCAHFSDGTAKCWGYNSTYGQLGTNSAIWSWGTSPWNLGTNLGFVGGGLVFKKIATTRQQIGCGILSNDTLKCWGYNTYGGLGQDGTGTLMNIAAIPAINLGAGRTAKDVSSGGYHTCAILDNNTVKCWGLNGQAQLGAGVPYAGATQNLGDQAGEMAALATVNLGTGLLAQKIYSGDRHNCVIFTNGKVKCWGQNTSGELGQERMGTNIGFLAADMGDNLPFTNLGTGRTAIKLGLGANHACALLDNAKVKCWGNNGYGQLGYNTTINFGTTSLQMGDNRPYVDLGTGRTAVDITAGYYHTCAVLDNNDVKCWGNNQYGQLGQGHTMRLGDNLGEMGNSLLPLVLD